MPITPVFWCHQFSPHFFMKYDVIFQRPVQWYDPGKCEVTPISPNVTSITKASRKLKCSPRQGRVFRVDQHLLNTWIRKIMSLPFWFNHNIGLILLQCDNLITMISTSGTYIQYLLYMFVAHGSKTEWAENHTHSLESQSTKLQKHCPTLL